MFRDAVPDSSQSVAGSLAIIDFKIMNYLHLSK